MSASPEHVTRAEVEGMTSELLVDHLIDAGFSAYDLRKLESKYGILYNTYNRNAVCIN